MLSVSYGKNTPRVSALVSTYASADFIGDCLQDLTSQTIADEVEIVVVDAASPEDERSVVRSFQKDCDNIVYHRTSERIGIYAAWNLAARLASGRYLMSASTNDRLAPNTCETLADALDAEPEVALVYGDSYLTETPHLAFADFDQAKHGNGEMSWPPFCYEELVVRCMVGPHAMWRASVHNDDDVGMFDESFKALGDQDFWLRIGANHQVRHLEFHTGLYWQTPDALSVQPNTQEELARIRVKYMTEYLNRPELAVHGPIVQQIQQLIANRQLGEAIKLFFDIFMPALLNARFNDFSADLAALLNAGKVEQALAYYQRERHKHVRLEGIGQLDEIMNRLQAA